MCEIMISFGSMAWPYCLGQDVRESVMTDKDSVSSEVARSGEQPEGVAQVLLAPQTPTTTTWQDPLAFVAAGKSMSALYQGTLLAQSDEVIIVHEQGHQPVSYFPRRDVRLQTLTSVDQTSHCPRKGDASYFAPAGDMRTVVAWSYEDPIPAALILKDYVAFYADKIELRKED
jgi:uncharacterized protein (DUF427 family)